ncbi:MAG: helix-turn-helix domain-containing protein [Trebonia sp.]
MDDPPGAENWAAVGNALQERMRELKMSKADLARETGLSETTIRYLGRSGNGHYKSALIAISVVLRWRHDHLTNILRGQPEKNVHVKSLGLANLERLVHAEVSPIRDEMSELTEIIQAIEKRIDMLLAEDPGTAASAVRAREAN